MHVRSCRVKQLATLCTHQPPHHSSTRSAHHCPIHRPPFSAGMRAGLEEGRRLGIGKGFELGAFGYTQLETAASAGRHCITACRRIKSPCHRHHHHYHHHHSARRPRGWSLRWLCRCLACGSSRTIRPPASTRAAQHCWHGSGTGRLPAV